MTATNEPPGSRERVTAEEWARRVCTLLVAGVAAYASYQHQRDYARVGGGVVACPAWGEGMGMSLHKGGSGDIG